ncbi:Cytochrome c oxidase subunit 7A-related protein, mitochondrial [Camponotus japonicus]
MPFYQYNSFTGRIKPSANFQPLYPLSPVPLQRTEPPVMIYDTIKTKPVTVTPKSGYSTDKPTSLDPKLYQKFKLFQANMDNPVYLAGGKKDKILFGITVAYIGICTVQSLVFAAKECLNII